MVTKVYNLAHTITEDMLCFYLNKDGHACRMERFFMQRASAIAYLMDRRRRTLEQIEAAPDEGGDSARHELDLLDRLILDVRAARIDTFQFNHPQAIAIYISED